MSAATAAPKAASYEFERRNVEFPSCGAMLRGHLYVPKKKTASPAIVMAPGFGGVKEANLALYSEVFVRAGFVCLAFDNINFGESGGEPRQEVDWMLQQRGYVDAITFVGLQGEVDKKRIGIFGSSYAGKHVLRVGAIDRRVKCVVSQVPGISGLVTRYRNNAFPQDLLNEDRDARMRGEKPKMIPMVYKRGTNELGAMPVENMETFVKRQEGPTTWKNEVTLRSIEDGRGADSLAYVPHISPTPLMMIIAREDVLAHADVAFEAYHQAREPKKLVIVNGHHFSVYAEHFEQTSGEALAWYSEHLRIND